MITFNPDNHTYWDDGGQQYTSVTTLLAKEFPFNAEEIANKVNKFSSSRYHGMSPERILRLWEDSSSHGNVVHEMIEDYIKEDVWPSDPSLYPLLEQFSKLNFRGDLLSEVLVWDEDYRIAGTADILEVFDDKIYLFDIKTSNKISEDKHMKFSMQLDMYCRMVEKRYKKPTTPVSIIWFEDYVVKRSKTKMRLIQPLRVSDSVDDILEKRRKEINEVD